MAGRAVDTLAQIDVSQAQSPGVAYALIGGSVLIALVPVLLAVLKDRGQPGPKADGKPDSPATPPLPAAVERGTDLAERYVTSLEARAERAEQLLEDTRRELDAERQRSAENALRMQRALDAAHAEITQLRSQIERLIWRSGGAP